MPASEPEIVMRPLALSELAARGSMTLAGEDREIVSFGALNTRSQRTDQLVTYLADPDLLPRMRELGIAACVVNESLAKRVDGASLLVTNGDPVEAFYRLLVGTARDGLWERLEPRRGRDVDIAASAVVHDNVQLGDECVLMDNVVVLPNSRLGDRVTVKPNATIGGDGFQVVTIDGRTMMVPHLGGVWIGDDVSIGSQTCIDSGMFGEFTVIGDETRLDNLIHVGHSTNLGPRGVVAASTEIGPITAGEGFWLAPRCAVLQGADLGEHSYVGIGSVVVRPVRPHALAYGVPARERGWVCSCRAKLRFEGGRAACGRCGRHWAEADDGIVEATGAPAA